MSTKAINLRTRHDGRTVTLFSDTGTELFTGKIKYVAGNANEFLFSDLFTNFIVGGMALYKNDRVVIHRRPRS